MYVNSVEEAVFKVKTVGECMTNDKFLLNSVINQLNRLGIKHDIYNTSLDWTIKAI